MSQKPTNDLSIPSTGLNTTELINQFYNLNYIEFSKAMSDNQSYSYFIKPNTKFGAGITNISLGLVMPFDYSSITDNPYTITKYQPKDNVETFEGKYQIIYSFLDDELSMIQKFNNGTDLAEYLQKRLAKLTTSRLYNQQVMIEAMLFNKTDPVGILTAEQKTLAKTIYDTAWIEGKTADKTSLTGTKDEMLELIIEINKKSDEFLTPRASNSISGKLASSVLRKDQVLVIPRKLKYAMDKALSDVRHPETYNLTGFYDVIYLDDIDRVYLFDKDLPYIANIIDQAREFSNITSKLQTNLIFERVGIFTNASAYCWKFTMASINV